MKKIMQLIWITPEKFNAISVCRPLWVYGFRLHRLIARMLQKHPVVWLKPFVMSDYAMVSQGASGLRIRDIF
jgi:hypothetical protein